MSNDKLDRVVMDWFDWLKIRQWRDENKDLVRQFRPALEDGVIQFTSENDVEYEVVFHHRELVVDYEVYVEGRKIVELKYMPDTMRVLSYTVTPVIPKEQHDTLLNDAITIHASAMAYMSYFQGVEELVEERTVRTTKSKKGKGGKKKSRVVNITKKVYKLTVPFDIPKVKRGFNRHTDAWQVRGHMRKLKSGKEVWVRPYVKGDKSKKEPTIYKV